MEPITIDKPCASLDILPMLFNIFGLEYDSRLLMGSDILLSVNALDEWLGKKKPDII